MNAEKLAKLQASVRIGGKGTARRKIKKNATGNVSGADKKLGAMIKQLNVYPLDNILEVNMFGDSGKVLHFESPKVHASEQANTFLISGAPTEKEITELVPGILNQLGPDSLASLRKLAETYTAYQKPGEEGDDEIPTLIENFENAEIETKEETPAIEEIEEKESA